MPAEDPRRSARTVIVVVVTLFMLLFVGVPMFLHPGTGYTGVRFHPSPGFIIPKVIDVVPGSPAYRAGLRSGDVLSCVRPHVNALLFWREAGWYPEAYAPGEPVSVCYTRGGLTRRVTFTAAPRPPAPPLYGSDLLAVLRLLEYALLIVLAAVMVLGRPGWMTWTFFAYVVLLAPTTLGASNYLRLSDAATLAFNAFVALVSMANGLMVMFCAMVPLDRPPPGWRTRIFWLGACIAAANTIYSLLGSITSSFDVVTLPPPAVGVSISVGLVALTVVILIARVATTEAKERARFAWAALAIALMMIIDGIRSIGTMPVDSPVRVGASMLTFIPPVLLAYAVLKRHVIDLSFAMSRTVVYAIITTILIAVIGGVDWATSAFLHEARAALALDAAATIGVAFALNRVHRWIERSVDAVLFREKYEAERYLRRIGHSLVEAESEETVDRVIVRDPHHRLHLTSAALFRAGDGRYILSVSADPETSLPPAIESDHDLVRLLKAERSHVNLADLAFHHSGIALPIFQGRELTAFVIYGLHDDGTAIDPDELDALERLCESAGQAYTLIENASYRATMLARSRPT